MCIWFTLLMTPRHWIVAFRKHVFPVFCNPWPDFVGEGLLSTFRSGSLGRLILLSAFLEAESCLVPVSSRRARPWKGVVKQTAGIPNQEPDVGSRMTCGVGLCLVSFVWCGRVFSIFFPLSLLSSYLVRLLALSVLSVPFSSGAVFLKRVFSHARQGGVG